MLEFLSEINDPASWARSFTLTIIHLDFSGGHFFATLNGLG
jgi:hypothetical protein